MFDWSVRLGLPQGEAYVRFYAMLPWFALGLVTAAAAAFTVWRVALARGTTLPGWLGANTPLDVRALPALGLVCLGIFFALDGLGFVHGFFRQDDFSFLQVTREHDRLLPQLALYHNDHAYPLFRCEVWAVVKLAGSAATPATLATWFNVLIAASCVALLAAGCWLLHETGCSRRGLFLFPVVLWLWPGWGEFTAGFFTLAAYLQVQALTFAAAALMLRGFRRSSSNLLAAGLALVLLAVAIDTSGLAAFATTGIVSLSVVNRGQLPRWLGFATALVLVALSVKWFFATAFTHPYSPRELVQNPGGTAFALSTDLLRPTQLLAAIGLSLVAFGGAIAGYFLPTFVQFWTDRLSPQATLVVQGIQVLVLAAALLVAWLALRRLAPRDRIIVGTFLLNALVGVALVVLARAAYASEVPAALWWAKYHAFPLCWLGLAVVFASDRLLAACPVLPPRKVAAGLVLACGAVWFALSSWHVERLLFPTPLAYIGRGRYGNVENARQRARDLSVVLQDLQGLANATGSSRLRLPPPETWQAAFFARYSILEWGSDRAPTGVACLFWDMPAAAPHLGLQGTWAPLRELSPAAREYLRGIAWVRPAFAPAGP